MLQINYRGLNVPCTDPFVTPGYDNTRLTCTLAPGAGKDNGLMVKRGPANSVSQRINSTAWMHQAYDPPTINPNGVQCYPPNPSNGGRPDKTQPSVTCQPGDWAYITGINFGDSPDLSMYALFDPSIIDPNTSLPRILAEVRAPESCILAVGETCSHTMNVFKMPSLSGQMRQIQVRTLAANPFYSAFVNESPFNAVPIFVTYKPPVITSASVVGTPGGILSIRGQYFGALDSVVTVTVGGVPCASANSVVRVTGVNAATGDGTEITCPMPAGVGGRKDVVVVTDSNSSVGRQSGTGNAVFSYAKPSVSGVAVAAVNGGATQLSATAAPGTELVVVGNNFGTDASQLRVRFGTDNAFAACENTKVIEPHVKISCTVPTAQGLTMPVRVEAGNQVSDVSAITSERVVFTFTTRGCRTAGSSNYNPLATVDDGSCFLTGCTDASATNYLPPTAGVVKDTTPSMCTYPPIKIDVRMALKFDQYSADPTKYNNSFIDTMATNTGINKSRITVTGAKPGSTVFSTEIADVSAADRAASGEPSAYDAGATFKQKADSNQLTVTVRAWGMGKNGGRWRERGGRFG